MDQGWELVTIWEAYLKKKNTAAIFWLEKTIFFCRFPMGFPSWKIWEFEFFFPGFFRDFCWILGFKHHHPGSWNFPVPELVRSATEFEVSPKNDQKWWRHWKLAVLFFLAISKIKSFQKTFENIGNNIGCCFHPESLSKDSFKRILFVLNSFRCSI